MILDRSMSDEERDLLAMYNCGGLALRTYTWVTPYYEVDEDKPEGQEWYTQEAREEWIEYLAKCKFSDEEIEDMVAESDAAHLLLKFDFLEKIDYTDITKDGRYIAYRVFVITDTGDGSIYDTDFHFKVCINGFWYEKLGDGRVRLCDLDPGDAWDYPDSDLCYTSRIIYFRDRRGI